MHFQLASVIPVLLRTPAVLDAWLRDLPEEWIMATEGGESWSAFDNLGHFIHGEKTDWMPRLRIILEHGEDRVFDPYDRFAQFAISEGRTTAQLLDEFATRRAKNVEDLVALDLQPADFARRGRHPAFGVVTVAQLLSTWTAHDLGHLRQMARTMAKRLREDVGPWAEYLPVMNE